MQYHTLLTKTNNISHYHRLTPSNQSSKGKLPANKRLEELEHEPVLEWAGIATDANNTDEYGMLRIYVFVDMAAVAGSHRMATIITDHSEHSPRQHQAIFTFMGLRLGIVRGIAGAERSGTAKRGHVEPTMTGR